MSGSDEYARALERLFAIERSRGWDLKLERVREALRRLGSPEDAFEAVHVAGTNGKGTTAAAAHAILQAAGGPAGLYTSPHLVDFAERIRVGEDDASEETILRGIERVERRVLEAGVSLTFFEVATVLAFSIFAESGVRRAVVEVGLGGRLDATNVVRSRTSVITTIGWDHMAWLGATLGEIAGEKAGILRDGVPAVIGDVPSEARRVLAERVAALGIPSSWWGDHFHATGEPDSFRFRGLRALDELAVPLRGPFPVRNTALAIEAVDRAGWGLDAETTRAALGRIRWPGRWHRLAGRPSILLDGAHNESAISAVAAALAPGRRRRLVVSQLSDRLPGILLPLLEVVEDATVVPIRNARAADPRGIAEVLGTRVPSRVLPSTAEALDMMVEENCGEDVEILVTGSLFLVGEALSWARESRRRVESWVGPW